MPAKKHTDAELLLQASGEILLLLDVPSLCILAANPTAYRLLGYAPEQLLGLPIVNLECALSDVFFWDEMGAQTQAQQAESELRCADGTQLKVSKWVQRLPGPPQRYLVRANPQTQHSRIEADLLEMGSRLRAMLEATAEGILVLDHSGAIINMNQHFSEMWRVPHELLVQRDDAGVLAHMRSLCQSGSPLLGDGPPDGSAGESTGALGEVHLSDGRVLDCAVRSATSAQELIGQVYSYRDVTERHNTQQELIAARDAAKRGSEAKSAFLAMMSHEIRTPLNGVLGFAQLLAGTELDEAQTEYVQIIETSGQTLLAILNDILDFSKIEAGKLELERTLFQFQPLLDDIAALFQYRQRSRGPQLSFESEAGLPVELMGDPVRLRQILFNLVGNAFKFTDSGSIRVRVRQLPAPVGAHPQRRVVGLHLSVTDTGIGISAEQQQRLFRSFEQADGSTTRKYGGTGLGLAICKRLVEMMGGQIGVNSAPGQGAEFWFTAWLELPPAEPVPEVVLETGAQAPNDKLASSPFRLNPDWRILLVEDNPVNRKVMLGVLKRMGATAPSIAENGQIALDLAAQQDFDLVLMDMQMPVLDGVSATRGLRQAGFAGPIIGVSAGALAEERQAALDAGADDYVLKPLRAEILAQALDRVLHGRNG